MNRHCSVLDDGERLAAVLLEPAARAVRANAVREAFGDHARQSVGDAFEHLRPDLREQMFANAEVFFDLAIPALVDYRPLSATQALRRIDIPLCVMADANIPVHHRFGPRDGWPRRWTPNCAI
jgi:hypothetical protein